MPGDSDSSLSTTDDSIVDEICELVSIKHVKKKKRRKLTQQGMISTYNPLQNHKTTFNRSEPDEMEWQKSEGSDNLLVGISSIDEIEITGDFNVTERTEKRHSNEQDKTTVQPTPSTSKLQQTPNKPKIIILENRLLPVTNNFHGVTQSDRKRQNKANSNSKKWQRELNKKLREEGKPYLGYRRDRKVDQNNSNFKVLHDTLKPAKEMGPRCESDTCKKSKVRGCETITEEERQSIFTHFWKTMTWEQRRQFVSSNITTMPCKRKVTKSETSRKSESKAYFLSVSRNSNVVKIQVCRGMFLHTLGISEWFIRYWTDKTKTTNGIAPKSETSLRRRTSPKKKEETRSLTDFFDRLPKLPSHYCQQSSSRLYLEPSVRNISELYEIYKKDCEEKEIPFLCRRSFDNEFLRSNLSLYKPKKDQCDFCCAHKVGSVTEEAWKKHIDLKNRARAEKATDKSLACSGTCHVLTQDVQAVKMSPSLQASALYFKTKLCVHNFTTYNLANHEVRCYWFDESNGGLEASVFASCIVDNILHLLNMKKVPVILYSDGCCAQNRNSYLSNALLRMAIENDVQITQKFLVKGHTQMECDSVHSTIESKLKGQDIYLPSQYSAITKAARVQPKPYESIYLDFDFFTDFSKPEDQIYKSIRPGKKAGDPTVTDVCALIYKPDGTIWYKLDFNEEPKILPQRPTKCHVSSLNTLPKLYTRRLPIAERKWQHLQDLKEVIPSDCHTFYDNLPH